MWNLTLVTFCVVYWSVFLKPYDRVSVTVGMILLSLVLFLVVDLPARTFAFELLGSPLTVQLSEMWLRAMLAAGLAIAGTHSAISVHPLVRSGQRRAGLTAWIVPGLIGFLAPFLLPLAPGLGYWLAGLGLTAFLIGSVILLEYHTVGRPARYFGLPGTGHSGQSTEVADGVVARLALNLLTYGVALAAFVLLYQSRARSLVTASAMVLVSSLMALNLLQGIGQPMRRTALYAGLTGLVMGECMWALNYWRIHALTGGVLLLLFFYVAVGLAQQHLQGSLTRRVLVEFLTVIAIGVWLLFRFGVQLGS